MDSLNIHLEQEDARFGLAERVTGEIEWRLDQRPKTVLLCLYWQTSGKAAARDQQIINRLELEKPGMTGRRSFSFQLPHGPCSFEGKAIRLQWSLELSAPGTGATSCVKKIEVSHLRRTVLLGDA